MTDLVSVAANAVASYQRALGTVSNNIANVFTDGYSRQEVVLQANPVAKVGTVYLGTGVALNTVKRQYDTFIEANLRKSSRVAAYSRFGVVVFLFLIKNGNPRSHGNWFGEKRWALVG